jgi:hypothetical protein
MSEAATPPGPRSPPDAGRPVTTARPARAARVLGGRAGDHQARLIQNAVAMGPLHGLIHRPCQAEIVGGENTRFIQSSGSSRRINTGGKPESILDMRPGPRGLRVARLDIRRTIPGGQRSPLQRRSRRVDGMDQVGVPDHPRAGRWVPAAAAPVRAPGADPNSSRRAIARSRPRHWRGVLPAA